MTTREYHEEIMAARRDREAATYEARQAERRALTATRCGCVYPAECRCADRPAERAAYMAAYRALRVVEDEAEIEYQQRLARIAAKHG